MNPFALAVSNGVNPQQARKRIQRTGFWLGSHFSLKQQIICEVLWYSYIPPTVQSVILCACFQFHVVLLISSELFPKQDWATNLCNGHGMYFLCGTDWILNIMKASIGFQLFIHGGAVQHDAPFRVLQWIVKQNNLSWNVIMWVQIGNFVQIFQPPFLLIGKGWGVECIAS